MRAYRFDDDLAVWTAPDNWARRLMTQHAEAEAIEYYDLLTGRRASEGRGDPSPTLPLPTSEPGPAVHDAAPATPSILPSSLAGSSFGCSPTQSSPDPNKLIRAGRTHPSETARPLSQLIRARLVVAAGVLSLAILLALLGRA